MNKELIEKYKNEMLSMYRTAKAVPTAATGEMPPPADTLPTPAIKEKNTEDSQGGLIGIVTSLRSIYPVKGAKVTVFTGNYYDDMQVIDTDYTDESGRTKEFILPTPQKSLSETAGASDKPYASYNMLVQSDGYIDNIHLNIPVFSTITSLQESNLMLSETAGTDKGPQVYDEGQEFTL